MHGYGWALPTGKGLGPGNILAGPWLRPSLWRKGIRDFEQGAELVKRAIDMFNAMLLKVQKNHPEYFQYIDVRHVISRSDWVNELHLKPSGFAKVANEIGRAVKVHLVKK